MVWARATRTTWWRIVAARRRRAPLRRNMDALAPARCLRPARGRARAHRRRGEIAKRTTKLPQLVPEARASPPTYLGVQQATVGVRDVRRSVPAFQRCANANPLDAYLDRQNQCAHFPTAASEASGVHAHAALLRPRRALGDASACQSVARIGPPGAFLVRTSIFVASRRLGVMSPRSICVTYDASTSSSSPRSIVVRPLTLRKAARRSAGEGLADMQRP